MVVFAQRRDGILHFAPDGSLNGAFGGNDWLGAHGLTYQSHGGRESLWLTDQDSAKVAKTSLTGDVLVDLPTIDYTAPDSQPQTRYKPTWAAEHPDTGEVWVADGYGHGVVHRLQPNGALIQTLTGDEGAGRFRCPHAVAMTPDGRIAIADRGNHRIVLYDAEGNHLETHQDICHSPCCFDFHDGLVLVPELWTGVKLMDAFWDPVAEIGASDTVGMTPKPGGGFDPFTPDGWPNLAGTDHIQAGRFNSPHGGCFAPNGDVYIAEWIVGGRITKLERR